MTAAAGGSQERLWSLLGGMALLAPVAAPGVALVPALRVAVPLALVAWALAVAARRRLVWSPHPVQWAALAYLVSQAVTVPGCTGPGEAALGWADRALVVLAAVLAGHVGGDVLARAAVAAGAVALAARFGGGGVTDAGAGALAPVVALLAFGSAHGAGTPVRALFLVVAAGAGAIALRSALLVPVGALLAGVVALVVAARRMDAALADDVLPARGLLVLGASMALAAALAGGTALDRPARAPLWRASAAMLQGSPIVGVGIDNFRHQIPWHAKDLGAAGEAVARARGPRSDLLRFLAETGLAGSVGLFVLAWAALRALGERLAVGGGGGWTAVGWAGGLTAQIVCALVSEEGAGLAGWVLLAVVGGALVVPRAERSASAAWAALLVPPCAVWVLLGAAWWEWSEVRGDRAFARARALVARHRVVEAHPELHEAMALKPLDPDVALETAELCFELRHLPDAQLAAAEAMDRSPSDTRALMLVGEVHLAMDEPVPAMRAFQAVLELEPGSARALDKLAIAATGAGEKDVAARALARAIQVGGETLERVLASGRAAWARGEMDVALREMERAVARWPGEASAHLGVAQVHRVRQEPSLAEAAFRKALALEPGLVSASIQLGLMLAAGNRRTEGLALLLETLARGFDGPELRAALAHLAPPGSPAPRQPGDSLALARSLARAELARDPGQVPLDRALAVLEARAGDRATGRTALERLAVAAPADEVVQVELVEALRRDAPPASARTAVSAALAKLPGSARLHHLDALIAEQAGELARALAAARRAVALPGADIAALLDLARLLERVGERAAAEAALLKLVDGAGSRRALRRDAQAQLERLRAMP